MSEERRTHTRRANNMREHVIFAASVLTIVVNILVMGRVLMTLEKRLTRLETVQEIIIQRTGILDEDEATGHNFHGNNADQPKT